jgi:hypothetical protein
VEGVFVDEFAFLHAYTPHELQITRIEKIVPKSTARARLLDRFTITRKELRQASIRKYRRLHESLSIDNGPWSTPEVVRCAHFKLSNSIFRGRIRTRLKQNRFFQDHRDAALARDVGSLETANKLYQTELALRRSTEFKADFALKQLNGLGNPRPGRVLTPEISSHTYLAELVKPEEVHAGVLWFGPTDLFFDSRNLTLAISLSRIYKIFFRRYLHMEPAIEIFTTDSRAYFLNFPQQNRHSFLKTLLAQKPPFLKYCQRSTQEAKALAMKATRKWQAGKLSNFDYLMKINLYAGRTYNDLSQYPVFPWILRDYSSAMLDLDNSGVYRDLGRPIGTINPDRLALLGEEREFSDAQGVYLYGALYSSSAVVVGYLIRLEPFTSLHIALQGGRFDHPDRLFGSIPDTWASVASLQPDYRELIPEFFVFPEFLVNSSHFDLGMLSTNSPVGDVKLPPWARSPAEFIAIHRAALESKFVTEDLHRWIDLLFGPGARLPKARELGNVFHPFFYDSAVTPAVEKSPRDLKGVQEFTLFFGAVPAQLFDEMPPQRALYISDFGTQFISRIECARQFTGLIADGDLLLGATANMEFSAFKKGEEVLKGRFDFPFPKVAGVFPLLAISKKNAVACFPSNRTFFIFALRNGNCSPIAQCVGHARPITALAIFGNSCVSVSDDCPLALTSFSEAEKLFAIRVPHKRPVVFIRIRSLFSEVVAISRDGFCSVSSLPGQRFVAGVQLPNSNPADMIVSARGCIVVAFKSPGCLLLVALGANLDIQAEVAVDASFACWETVELNGIDYLVMALTGNRLSVLRLPMLAAVVTGREIPFALAAMAFVRKDGMLYGTDGGKRIYGLPVGYVGVD